MDHRVVVVQSTTARTLCRALLRCGKWFEATPLPDGQWEFKAKDEPGLPSIRAWNKVQPESAMHKLTSWLDNHPSAAAKVTQ